MVVKGKRILALFVSIVMLVGLLPTTSIALSDVTVETRDFSDMPNDWSTIALEHAVDNNLLLGSNGYLIPNGQLTRAEMATIITRAFNASAKADISAFPDVISTDWYSEYIAKAYQMGIINGSDGLMKPNNAITRQEVFAIIARAIKLQNADKIYEKFSDVKDIAVWAKGEIYAMANAGYIQGSNGKLNPEGLITRAEFAQVMYNIFRHYIDKNYVATAVTNGNVIINIPGITLKNTTIQGDLIIGDGVGDGEVILDNVIVTGRMVVRGGGENSIIIKGSSVISSIIVTRIDGVVSVKVQDDANVEVIYIDDGSDDVNIEGTVGDVQIIASAITVNTIGASISNIYIHGEGSQLLIDSGSSVSSVNVLAVDVSISVAGNVTEISTTANGTVISGTGCVTTVDVQTGASGTRITTPNTHINVAGDVTGVTGGGGIPITAGTSETNNTEGNNIVKEPVPDDNGSTGGSSGSGSGDGAGNGTGSGTGGGGINPPIDPLNISVTGVSLNQTTLELPQILPSAKITAIIYPSNATNKSVIWTSSNINVATVSNDGTITPVGTGTTIITVTTVDGGKTAECAVTVIKVGLVAANLTQLKVALTDERYDSVLLVSDISNIDETLVINREFTINGNGHKLTFTDSINTKEDNQREGILISANDVCLNDLTVQMDAVSNPSWQGVFGIQVYDATGVVFHKVSVKGADGGISVNGSTLTLGIHLLEVPIDVSDNEFVGIEVLKDSSLTNESVLYFNQQIINNSEAYGKPTLWVVNEQGTLFGRYAPTFINDQLTEDKKQYYIERVNIFDPATIANVNNLEELKTALSDNIVDTINILSDISNITAPVVINHPVTIYGGNKTLTFSGLENLSPDDNDGLVIKASATIYGLSVDAGLNNTSEWVESFAIHVYDTTATFDKISATGANGGILVNGSTVVLKNAVNISGNGFVGIEVSKDNTTSNQSSLSIIFANISNATEEYGKPTIWEDGISGAVIHTSLTMITIGTQRQYYHMNVNAHTVDVATLNEITTAIADINITTINLTSSLSELSAPLIINRALKINGGGNTISFTSALNTNENGGHQGILINSNSVIINNLNIQMYGETGWQDLYGIKINDTMSVILDNISINGVDVGFHINGSEVTLKGIIDISGSEFWGIQLSIGSGIINYPSVQSIGATIINTSETFEKPTIWTDKTATGNVLVAGLTKIQKGSHKQYYLSLANATDPNSVDVNTITELETALANNKSTINITNEIVTTKTLVIDYPVVINGNNHLVKFEGDEVGWNSNYIFHVYKTDEVVFMSMLLSKGDAALLIDSSEVTLSNSFVMGWSEFGGIELSKNDVADNQPLLFINDARLTYITEEYDHPVLWENGTDANRVIGGTFIKIIKGDQVQYYSSDSNYSKISVETLDELMAALENEEIYTIYIGADILNIDEMIVIDRDIYINGGNHILSFTDKINEIASTVKQGIFITASGVTIIDLSIQMSASENTQWDGVYGIHVYDAIDVSFVKFNVSGADCGILVNGSSIYITNGIDVSNNEFGGIELSRDDGLSRESLIGTNSLQSFVNSTEAPGNPTIWIEHDDDTKKTPQGTVIINRLYKNYVSIGDTYQTQYFINPAPVDLASITTVGTIILGTGETFKLTVQASGADVTALVVDHNIESLPEFTVYTDVTDPYGGAIESFASLGVTVTFDADTKTWVIDFGVEITEHLILNGSITFYLVIKSASGYEWGSMYDVTNNNSFTYNISELVSEK